MFFNVVFCFGDGRIVPDSVMVFFVEKVVSL